jgi:ribosomal protein S18 acetylase RimI-like enzyme
MLEMKLDTVRTRPATAADAEFLWALHRECMHPYVERIWGWDDARQRRHFRGLLDVSECHVVMLAGLAVGSRLVQRCPERIFLASIEILPAFQGQGIGTRLLTELREEASRAELPLELHVLKLNPALRLYTRLGFRRIAETAAHEVMRFSAGVARPFVSAQEAIAAQLPDAGSLAAA